MTMHRESVVHSPTWSCALLILLTGTVWFLSNPCLCWLVLSVLKLALPSGLVRSIHILQFLTLTNVSFYWWWNMITRLYKHIRSGSWSSEVGEYQWVRIAHPPLPVIFCWTNRQCYNVVHPWFSTHFPLPRPRPKLQKPCRYGWDKRPESHDWLYGDMEFSDGENRIDSSDYCQPGHWKPFLSFQLEAFCHKSPKCTYMVFTFCFTRQLLIS